MALYLGFEGPKCSQGVEMLADTYESISLHQEVR